MFGFVGEIVDIFAIFPQGQTLIVMSASIPIANPVRIANEERSELIGNTEVDHVAGGLVSLVTDTPFSTSDQFLSRRDSRVSQRGNHSALHDRMPREGEAWLC